MALRWIDYERGTALKKVGFIIVTFFVLLFLVPLFFLKEVDHKEKLPIKEEGSYKINVYMADLSKTVEMDLEEYLLGVVAGEMPLSFHIEALKAQALAARTYTLMRMKSFGGVGCSKYPDADICTDSTHCQAYKPIAGTKTDTKKLKEAVYGTRGEVIIYGSKLIDAVFHSTSGGKTENSEDVWTSRVPYLRSVISDFEEKSPKLVTQKEVSVNDFVAAMKRIDSAIQLDAKKLESQVKILERSEGGRIIKIQVGNKIVKGNEIRDKLGLNSTNFRFSINKDSVNFVVIGYGHGIGMSQYGADGMANNGSTYTEIVKHYYNGVDIVDLDDLVNAGTK